MFLANAAATIYRLSTLCLQAAINNPNVSEEAKEHSRQAIEALEDEPETQEIRASHDEGKDEVRQNAGFKATLKSESLDVINALRELTAYVGRS